MRHYLPILFMLGCIDHGFVDASREFGPPVESEKLHAVRIHQPETLGVADTSFKDVNGLPIGVSCVTCHGPTPDASWVNATTEEDMHGHVELVHGNLACASCHDADKTRLHLADGTKLDMEDAMTLCAQCHGVQFRDYSRGSHGGMNGYWDRRRGPRDRNHCVDCHTPHAPAYQPVMPVHPPRDRYLIPSTPQEAH